MNLLVTGATGFVGKALCERLDAEGHNVRRVVGPHTPNGLEGPPLVLDVGPNTNWTSALDGIDVVFHLAAVTHARARRLDSTLESVNVDGTRCLGEAAARVGVRRFVFVSSIKAIGDEGVVNDESSPAPTSRYGASKLAAENALRAIERETSLTVAIVRPPLVYGPGVKANFLALMSAVAREIPLPLGSIRNRRSFVFVGNLVDALIVAGIHPRAARETWLVSDGDDRSTPELVRDIAASLGVRPRLLPCPPGLLEFAGRCAGRADLVQGLSATLVADSQRIATRLQWCPTTTLEQGLAETARWFYSRQAH